MGIFGEFLGNASSLDIEKIEPELKRFLVTGEKIEYAYRVLRDMIIFTDKRLILIDRQGVTGRRTSYNSVPYRIITNFRIETAGTIDINSSLEIWIFGNYGKISRTFSRGDLIYEVYGILASYVL